MYEEYEKLEDRHESVVVALIVAIIMIVIVSILATISYGKLQKLRMEVANTEVVEVQYDFYQLEVEDRVDRFNSEEGFYYNYLFTIIDTRTYFEVGYQKWFKDFEKYEEGSIILVILVDGKIEDFILMEGVE